MYIVRALTNLEDNRSLILSHFYEQNNWEPILVQTFPLRVILNTKWYDIVSYRPETNEVETAL